MSVQPAIIPGSVATPSGVANIVSDIKRRLARLEAEKTRIGSKALNGGQLADNTITGGNISPGSISTGEIAAGSITAALISAGAINAGHIQAHAITANEIAANAITATELAAGSVVAGDLTAGAVTAGTIAAGAVTATTIAADAVTTTSILAGAVTAAKISVSTLSALTTNMGSLTAGTITGATIQSGSSGSRTVMDSLGFRGYALDGVTKTFEINTGTGIASFTGVATLDPTSVIPGGSITGTIPGTTIPPIGGGNLLTNSGFENGTSNWLNSSNAGIANSTATGTFRSGTQSIQITSAAALDTRFRGQITDATKMAQVVAGEKITGSIYSKAATTTRSGRVRFGFYDSSLAVVGVTLLGPSLTNSTTAWTRHTFTTTVPATATYAILYGETLANAAGEVHYWDNAQIEVGEVVTAYMPKADEILPLTVTGAMIADTTVTESKISGTISGAKITDGTVTDTKITAVGAAKVTGQLTDAQIAALAASKLTGQITSTQITDGSITTPKIFAGAVTTNELAANSVTATQIATDAVTSAKIFAGSITTAKIAAGAVTATEVAAGAITTNKLNVVVGGGNFLSNSGFEDVVTPFSSWNSPVRSTRVLDQVVFKKGFGFNSAKLTITDVTGQAYMVAPASSADYSEVIVGRFYTSSFWTKANAAYATQAQASIQWYDASDALVSSSVGTAVNSSTSWQRIICTAAAPAGAVKARIVTYVVRASSGTIGDIYWVDDVQLEEGDVPTSYAPRTDEILPGTIVANMLAADTITAAQIGANAITATELAAGAVTANKLLVTMGGGNLLTNSGFEDTTLFNWANNINSTPVATSGAGTVRSGTSALQMTAIAAGDMRVRSLNANNIPSMAQARPGDTVTVSAYSKAATTPRSGRVRIAWYDATSPTPVAIGSTVTGSSTTNSTTDWTRHTLTSVAPASTAYLVMYVDIVAAALGEVHYWDDAQIEIGDVATAYRPKAVELLPGTIVASMVATDTLTANEIASNAITVNELAANAVTAAKIAANTITASQIAGATITATQMAANSITATQIAAGAVTANAVLAGSIQAQHMSFVSASQNMHLDSGFELAPTSLTPWQNSTATYSISSTSPKSGSSVGVNTALGAVILNDIRTRDTLAPGVITGKAYSAQVYVRQAAATANRQAALIISYLDAANTLLSTSTIVYTTLPGNTTTWTLLTVPAFTAPAGAVKARITVRHRNSDGVTALAVGEAIHMDELSLVPGDVLPTTWEPKAGDLQPGSVGNTVLAPDSVTTDKILASTILGGDIAATTITGTNIAATTITAGHIASGTITAVQLAAGSVTADKINVGPISTQPNLLPNSSFERRAPGPGTGSAANVAPVAWNAIAGCVLTAVDASTNVDGKAVLVAAPITGTSTMTYAENSEKIAVLGGETLFVSGYVRKQTGHAGTTTACVAINFYTSGGVPVDQTGLVGVHGTNGSASTTTITDTANFTRLNYSRVVPATNAAYAMAYLGTQTTAANSTTGLVWDCAQLEKSLSLSTWSLRPVELAIPGTEILPGSIYTGNIVANSIDGQLITGALIRTGIDDTLNAQFTSNGLTLPIDSSASPGNTPAVIQWTYQGGTKYGNIYQSEVSGTGQMQFYNLWQRSGATDYQEQSHVVRNTAGAVGGSTQLIRMGAADRNFYLLRLRKPSNNNIGLEIHGEISGGGTQVWTFLNTTDNFASAFTGGRLEAATYAIWSDERLKSQIEPAKVGLAETKKLKPKRFTLHGDPEKKRVLGFVAQDVEKVLPEAVSTTEIEASEKYPYGIPKTKSYDLSQIVALGVQTDIELDARIDALEAELAELKASLS